MATHNPSNLAVQAIINDLLVDLTKTVDQKHDALIDLSQFIDQAIDRLLSGDAQ